MTTPATIGTTLRSCPPDYRRAFFLGWCDAMEGAPFPPDYDGFDENRQLGYESGRLSWHNVRCARLTVPWWNGTAAGAELIDRIIICAVVATGRAIPPEFAPELAEAA